MKAIKVLAILLLGGITSETFAGGPWLQEKNAGYFQVYGVIPAYAYSSLLNGSFINDVQGVNRKTIHSDFGFYSEYGISDNLNVIAKLPYKYVSTGELTDQTYFPEVLPAGSLSGLGNVELDIKHKILDENLKVAVSLNTLWNTANQDFEKGLATGYSANAFGLTAHIGRGSEKHYGFLEIGYQNFTNNFSDVLELTIEYGWKLGDRFYLMAVLNVSQSLKNGDYFNANLLQTGLYPNNQEWGYISAKMAYETKNGWGINAALPVMPIKFKYVGFNGTIGLGVFKKI